MCLLWDSRVVVQCCVLFDKINCNFQLAHGRGITVIAELVDPQTICASKKLKLEI